MTEAPNQFKRKPRQAAPKGKRVTVSAETRQAYEKLAEERSARDKAYTQHLPTSDKIGR